MENSKTQYIVEKAVETGEVTEKRGAVFQKNKPKAGSMTRVPFLWGALTPFRPFFGCYKALKWRFFAYGRLRAIFFTFFAKMGQKTIEIT